MVDFSKRNPVGPCAGLSWSFGGKPTVRLYDRVLSPSEIEFLSIVPTPSALWPSLGGFTSISLCVTLTLCLMFCEHRLCGMQFGAHASDRYLFLFGPFVTL